MSKDKVALEKRLSTFDQVHGLLDDALTLLTMGEEERDETTWAEGHAALLSLQKRLARLELEVLLSGDADANNCYLSVNAGAGGTEAQDWTEMILRMYVRYAERRGYRCTLMEESQGEEAGLKSSNNSHGGGFTGTVRAQKSQNIPNVDIERNIGQNPSIPESVGHPLHGNRNRHNGHTVSRFFWHTPLLD